LSANWFVSETSRKLLSCKRSPVKRECADLQMRRNTADMAYMKFRLLNSQRYLGNANPDTNHSANPTNPKR